MRHIRKYRGKSGILSDLCEIILIKCEYNIYLFAYEAYTSSISFNPKNLFGEVPNVYITN